MKKLIKIFWAMSALAGCVREPAELYPSGEGAKDLELNISIPEDDAQRTRAITANEENGIGEIDVLAFKINADGSETFDYATTGTLTTNTGTQLQTFVAKLRIESYKQRFVVITNAHNVISPVIATNTWQGAPKATMLAALKHKLGSSEDRWNSTSISNYTKIPMWGESVPETVTTGATKLSTPIYLLRMLARVDVQLDTTVSGLTSQFKLKSVAFYNTNKSGQVVPDAAKVVTETRNALPYKYVNAITVPADVTRSRGPINYSDFSAPGVTDVSMIGAIYTYEVANSTDFANATFLVVGGLYGSDTTPSYYRVEFYASGTSNRLDLMRNCKYTVNITKVSGRGYASAEAAATSRTVNITANIMAWNMASLDNVTIDGTNTLRTNKDQLNLAADAYTAASATGDNTLTVTTNVPAGWTVASITDGTGSGTAPWVTFNPTSGAANTTTNAWIGATQNTSGASRSAIITLAAGRMRLPVRVTQSIYPALSLKLANSSGTEVQELVFNSPADTKPASQTLTVTWQPTTSTVSVVGSQNAQYDFPSKSSSPAVDDGSPYNGQTLAAGGSYTYTISPPALTSAELASNPFIVKSTRFDFTVGNGTSTITKSVTLRMSYYNLLIEDATNGFIYPMGTASTYPPASSTAINPGAVYRYNVRSNANWTITNIVETPRVAGQQLISKPTDSPTTGSTGGDNVYVNATGTPNTTPGGGYREQLTTNYKGRGFSGYADVTYGPTNSAVQNFTPVTRRLFFPAAPFTIYGITGMANSTASTYNIYSGSSYYANKYHPQSMVQAAVNYGISLSSNVPSSTVFVPQITVKGYNNNSTTTIAVQQITDAAAAGADMLIISGGTTWDANVSQSIYDNFLYKQKPVFICVEDANSFISLWKIFGSGMIYNSTTAMNGLAPVYLYQDVSDPILEGPFKVNGNTLRKAYWGCDGNGSVAYWFTDRTSVVKYSDATNQCGSTDSPPNGLTTASGTTMSDGYTSFRFTNVPLVFAADGGFMGCFDSDKTTSSPAILYDALQPNWKPGYGGGGGTTRSVANAHFLANMIAWAIQRRTWN